MPNTYFQFKQFIVHQDKTAMKVCTDACLFGAWAARQMQNEKCKIENVLDVGTGTGLLSLMLAQKSSAQIDSVEIDEAAYIQAKENFEASPWKSRLNIHHSSIQHFNNSTNQLYDLIISNPPFFEQSLKSLDDKKNRAKHADELSFEELTHFVLRRLKEDGKFYILLPYQEFQKFKEMASRNNLFLSHEVNIRQTEKHSYFRTIGAFSKTMQDNLESISITIKTNNEYHPAFTSLLQDYYLKL
jgi:tRNA1Val (adenine37-N6)-methyltransferase